MSAFFIVFTLGSALTGCGLLGDKGVPKEQINEDIAKNSVKVKLTSLNQDTDWTFRFDSERCFSVNDVESKITDSTADISVTVSAWQESLPIAPDPTTYYTIFGKMLLHYKKDGGKWVLESIEPKDLIYNDLNLEKFKKFVEIGQPQCRYFRYATWAK